MSQCIEFQDLLPIASLGVLEEEENTWLQEHIEECKECREIYWNYAQSASLLALSVDMHTPDPQLKERIMSQIKPKPADLRHEFVLSLPSPRKSMLKWALPVAAAALLTVGYWAGTHNSATSALDSRSFNGSGVMADSQVNVVDLRNGTTLLSFNNMPALSSDKVYEVWQVDEKGNAVREGVFHVDKFGRHTLLLSSSPKKNEKIAVTIEDSPLGSTIPTSVPQLIG